MTQPNPPKQPRRDRAEPDAPSEARQEDVELTDEQLDRVSGGSVSNVLKSRHDTVKNSIGN